MGCYWDEDGVEEAEGVLGGMLVSTGCLDGCGVCRIGGWKFTELESMETKDMYVVVRLCRGG